VAFVNKTVQFAMKTIVQQVLRIQSLY